METQQENPGSRKREDHLSKDGNWRSFPKVPHLLQYVPSGNYFGKINVNGRTFRESLQTQVWTTAQIKLNDFLKDKRGNRNKVDAPKFSEVVDSFKRELEHTTALKPRSKKYRLLCLHKIQSTWPAWKSHQLAVTQMHSSQLKNRQERQSEDLLEVARLRHR